MRYVARPRMDDDPPSPLLEPDSRIVYEPEPIDTGLVDKHESQIFRVMSPIGFVELRERD